jgi:hypothetical protein
VASVAGFGDSAAHACVVNAIALARRNDEPSFQREEGFTVAFSYVLGLFAINIRNSL